MKCHHTEGLSQVVNSISVPSVSQQVKDCAYQHIISGQSPAITCRNLSLDLGTIQMVTFCRRTVVTTRRNKDLKPNDSLTDAVHRHCCNFASYPMTYLQLLRKHQTRQLERDLWWKTERKLNLSLFHHPKKNRMVH